MWLRLKECQKTVWKDVKDLTLESCTCHVRYLYFGFYLIYHLLDLSQRTLSLQWSYHIFIGFVSCEMRAHNVSYVDLNSWSSWAQRLQVYTTMPGFIALCSHFLTNCIATRIFLKLRTKRKRWYGLELWILKTKSIWLSKSFPGKWGYL